MILAQAHNIIRFHPFLLQKVILAQARNMAEGTSRELKRKWGSGCAFHVKIDPEQEANEAKLLLDTLEGQIKEIVEQYRQTGGGDDDCNSNITDGENLGDNLYNEDGDDTDGENTTGSLQLGENVGKNLTNPFGTGVDGEDDSTGAMHDVGLDTNTSSTTSTSKNNKNSPNGSSTTTRIITIPWSAQDSMADIADLLSQPELIQKGVSFRVTTASLEEVFETVGEHAERRFGGIEGRGQLVDKEQDAKDLELACAPLLRFGKKETTSSWTQIIALVKARCLGYYIRSGAGVEDDSPDSVET